MNHIPGNEEVALYFDEYVNRVIDTENLHKYKVAYLLEPVDVIGTSAQKFILDNYNRFDLILTDQTPLLSLPNSRLFIFGTSWVHEKNPKPPVEFSVSSVFGHKKDTIGHKMRWELWERRKEISIPTKFYTSKHGGPKCDLKLIDVKTPLFESMFHIVIENSFSDYYMSEKLIDPLRSRAVPIYIGANKVEEFFDIDGILKAKNVDDVINICNQLTQKKYRDLRIHIENNKNLSDPYKKWHERIKNKIELEIL
jgi:hypothetical protein